MSEILRPLRMAGLAVVISLGGAACSKQDTGANTRRSTAADELPVKVLLLAVSRIQVLPQQKKLRHLQQ